MKIRNHFWNLTFLNSTLNLQTENFQVQTYQTIQVLFLITKSLECIRIVIDLA